MIKLHYISQLNVLFSLPYFILMFLSISFCRLFNEYEEYDFARTGSTATEKVLNIFFYNQSHLPFFYNKHA